MTDETLKGIPITTNFLKFEEGECVGDTYRIPWDEPNVKWRIKNIQGSRQLITNIQRDDSPHSPDLFLYTNITQKENTNAYAVAEDSIESINGDRRWYVKQVVKKKNRVGIRHFTTLPLGPFRDYWRKPLLPDEIKIGHSRRGLSSVRFKLIGGGVPHSKFRAFMDFPELELPGYAYTLEWLKKNCHDGIYLFSDYDSMFVDPVDEFAYIASCVSRNDK